MPTQKQYTSWGRYPEAPPKTIKTIEWRNALPDLDQMEPHVLPFGYGRSYGDSCLNEGGVLLDMTPMNQFIAFDRENGILCCEAGVCLADVIELIVPQGWYIPVSPGTKYVSIGGAIANDVHGKNHHVAGTFGCHVTQFELLRSDGERLICSPTQHKDYFAATIGGLGLTGVILWAEFKLKKIPTAFIDWQSIRFQSVDEFFELSAETADIPYAVSWVDCLASGKQFGRGLFNYGDFYDPPLGSIKQIKPSRQFPIPIEFPSFTVNTLTSRIFNEVYYRKQLKKKTRMVTHYDPFFYPLDVAADWYRVYGRNGFLQYQFVIPYEDRQPIKEILRQIVQSGQASPLVVFKTFGDIKSPGMLSFPRKGVTLALDFPFRGQPTLDLLNRLDEIVFANEGALYPAKDARMSPESFRLSYPCWEQFADYIDPKFSSSFWRRVTQSNNVK